MREKKKKQTRLNEERVRKIIQEEIGKLEIDLSPAYSPVSEKIELETLLQMLLKHINLKTDIINALCHLYTKKSVKVKKRGGAA